MLLVITSFLKTKIETTTDDLLGPFCPRLIVTEVLSNYKY